MIFDNIVNIGQHFPPTDSTTMGDEIPPIIKRQRSVKLHRHERSRIDTNSPDTLTTEEGTNVMLMKGNMATESVSKINW